MEYKYYSGNSEVILILPGRGGSVDGYDGKYRKIAENAALVHGNTVIIAANPEATLIKGDGGFSEIMAYVSRTMSKQFGEDYTISIFAHSIGATLSMVHAWRFPKIRHLLLVNPPLMINFHKIKRGLAQFMGESVTAIFGEFDPSRRYSGLLMTTHPDIEVITIPGADHNFSDESYNDFIKLPERFKYRQRQ
jgi:pimeloyl-ACP methyl ester carboxylesterase